jgi:amino acid transporter
VFLLFLVTHVLLIGGGLIGHGLDVGHVAAEVHQGFSSGLSTLGLAGMAALFARAYSLGGGTYTGIEAVSNGIPIMREPKVQTAQRTMVYMATSLALTRERPVALLHPRRRHGRAGEDAQRGAHGTRGRRSTGRGAFVDRDARGRGPAARRGRAGGFIDGPRVLSNMALDGWFPKRLSALSDRLTTQNGNRC